MSEKEEEERDGEDDLSVGDLSIYDEYLGNIMSVQEEIDDKQEKKRLYHELLPISRPRLNLLLIYIYLNEPVTPTNVQRNILSSYVSLVDFLERRGLITIERKGSRKKEYQMTEKGKKTVKKLIEANKMYMKDATIVCPACGETCEEGMNFCPACGSDLSK